MVFNGSEPIWGSACGVEIPFTSSEPTTSSTSEPATTIVSTTETTTSSTTEIPLTTSTMDTTKSSTTEIPTTTSTTTLGTTKNYQCGDLIPLNGNDSNQDHTTTIHQSTLDLDLF